MYYRIICVVCCARSNATLHRQPVSVIRGAQVQFMVLPRSNSEIYDLYLRNYCLYFLSSRISPGITIYQKLPPLTLTPMVLLFVFYRQRAAKRSQCFTPELQRHKRTHPIATNNVSSPAANQLRPINPRRAHVRRKGGPYREPSSHPSAVGHHKSSVPAGRAV